MPDLARTANALRVARHRQRQIARTKLLDILLSDPRIAALANAIVASNPALSGALANDPVMLANVSQSGEPTLANALQVAMVPAPPAPPSPQTPYPPPTPSPSPVHRHRSQLTTTALRPSDGAIEPIADDEPAYKLCFKVVVALLWPDGSTRSLDAKTRSHLAGVIKTIRERLVKHGVPEDQQPSFIEERLTAQRWSNAIGAKPKTINNLKEHWYTVMFGGDAKGRSNGYVHTAYLNESATLKHQPKFNSPEEYRRD